MQCRDCTVTWPLWYHGAQYCYDHWQERYGFAPDPTFASTKED